MARIFNTVLNNSGDSEHPCLAPDLREKKFQLFTGEYNVSCGLSYVAFTMLRFVSSTSALLSSYHKWILNFSCIY